MGNSSTVHKAHITHSNSIQGGLDKKKTDKENEKKRRQSSSGTRTMGYRAGLGVQPACIYTQTRSGKGIGIVSGHEKRHWKKRR